MKKTLIIVLVILIGVVLAYLYSQGHFTGDPKDSSFDNNYDSILFEKTEGWGPCRRNDFCSKVTSLYRSGRFVVKSKTTVENDVSDLVVDAVIEKIKRSNLMKKECKEEIIMDYSVKYRIILDGKTREFNNPLCAGFSEINTLLPKIEMQVDGGA